MKCKHLHIFPKIALKKESSLEQHFLHKSFFVVSGLKTQKATRKTHFFVCKSSFMYFVFMNLLYDFCIASNTQKKLYELILKNYTFTGTSSRLWRNMRRFEYFLPKEKKPRWYSWSRSWVRNLFEFVSSFSFLMFFFLRCCSLLHLFECIQLLCIFFSEKNMNIFYFSSVPSRDVFSLRLRLDWCLYGSRGKTSDDWWAPAQVQAKRDDEFSV